MYGSKLLSFAFCAYVASSLSKSTNSTSDYLTSPTGVNALKLTMFRRTSFRSEFTYFNPGETKYNSACLDGDKSLTEQNLPNNKDVVVKYTDGVVYKGPLNIYGKPHGQGTISGNHPTLGEIKCADCTFLQGNIQRGRIVSMNKSNDFEWYEGDFDDNLMHGKGSLKVQSDIYTGTFDKGSIVKGTWPRANGLTYTGRFTYEQGIPVPSDGKGKLINTMTGKTVYVGGFEHGVRSGLGFDLTPDSKLRYGLFQNDSVQKLELPNIFTMIPEEISGADVLRALYDDGSYYDGLFFRVATGSAKISLNKQEERELFTSLFGKTYGEDGVFKLVTYDSTCKFFQLTICDEMSLEIKNFGGFERYTPVITVKYSDNIEFRGTLDHNRKPSHGTVTGHHPTYGEVQCVDCQFVKGGLTKGTMVSSKFSYNVEAGKGTLQPKGDLLAELSNNATELLENLPSRVVLAAIAKEMLPQLAELMTSVPVLKRLQAEVVLAAIAKEMLPQLAKLVTSVPVLKSLQSEVVVAAIVKSQLSELAQKVSSTCLGASDCQKILSQSTNYQNFIRGLFRRSV